MCVGLPAAAVYALAGESSLATSTPSCVIMRYLSFGFVSRRCSSGPCAACADIFVLGPIERPFYVLCVCVHVVLSSFQSNHFVGLLTLDLIFLFQANLCSFAYCQFLAGLFGVSARRANSLRHAMLLKWRFVPAHFRTSCCTFYGRARAALLLCHSAVSCVLSHQITI